jgi:hypothetical protein
MKSYIALNLSAIAVLLLVAAAWPVKAADLVPNQNTATTKFVAAETCVSPRRYRRVSELEQRAFLSPLGKKDGSYVSGCCCAAADPVTKSVRQTIKRTVTVAPTSSLDVPLPPGPSMASKMRRRQPSSPTFPPDKVATFAPGALPVSPLEKQAQATHSLLSTAGCSLRGRRDDSVVLKRH